MKVPQIFLAIAACSLLNTACFVSVPAEAAKPTDAKPAADAKSTDAKSTDAKAPAKDVADVNDAGNNIFTHQKGGITFEKPEGWTHQADGDTLTLFSPDHAVSIVVTVSKNSKIDKAVSEIDSELSNVMTDIETTSKAHHADVNGMDAITVEGTGKITGTPVTWAVDLLDARRPVFVITFGRQDSWSEHEAEYAKFAQSVKRV